MKKTFCNIAILFCLTQIYSSDLPEKWTEDAGCMGFYVTLKSDKTMSINISCMGTWLDIEGRYEAAGNNVVFKSPRVKAKDHAEKYLPVAMTHLFQGSCKVTNLPTSLNDSRAINCSDGKLVLWDETTSVSAGEKRTIQGEPVITLKNIPGTTKACLKLRSKASTESKTLSYMPEMDGNSMKCIPKGSKVNLKARTADKKTVAGNNDFWYYTEDSNTGGGWVFGEFMVLP